MSCCARSYQKSADESSVFVKGEPHGSSHEPLGKVLVKSPASYIICFISVVTAQRK
jgi:hypothetical protein